LDFQLWQFDQAPIALRSIVPNAESGWWFALIQCEEPKELAAFLMQLWRSAGYCVSQHFDRESGLTILAARQNPPI
jgi:hypothetical protein